MELTVGYQDYRATWKHIASEFLVDDYYRELRPRLPETYFAYIELLDFSTDTETIRMVFSRFASSELHWLDRTVLPLLDLDKCDLRDEGLYPDHSTIWFLSQMPPVITPPDFNISMMAYSPGCIAELEEQGVTPDGRFPVYPWKTVIGWMRSVNAVAGFTTIGLSIVGPI